MRSWGRPAWLAGAMVAVAAAGMPPTAGSPDVRASSVTPGATVSNDRAPGLQTRALPAEAMRRLTGGMARTGPTPWPSREGWSNRRYQRAAAKRRAQAANRRNHRA